MSALKISELTALLNRVLKQVGHLRKGNNLQFFCPKCHHRKRKLEVCLDEPYKYHCWTCDFKGQGLYWLLKTVKAPQECFSKLENLVGSYRPKYNSNLTLGDQILLNIGKSQPTQNEIEFLQLPSEFKSLAENDGSIEYRIASNYAKKRKLTMCDIIKYNIGYCSIGPFANRLVFPSYSKDNSLNFYSCRSYYDDGYKYKNSEFSKDIIGFENMIDFDFPVTLCEGALDAISVKRNAIPLFGKTMSRKLKTALVQSNCTEVNIVLDDDALSSSIRLAEYIISIGKKVKLVRLAGKDPNVLGFQETLRQIKQTDMLDFGELTKLRLG